MATLNGGFYDYAGKDTQNIFCHKDGYESKVVTLKQGQVLKARTFLQSIQTGADKGKLIARSGMAEAALVTFATPLTAGQTLILGGLTFTAGSGGTSVAKLVTIWGGLPNGVGFATAAALILAEGIDATVDGTFTAGTLGAWEVSALDSNTVNFTSVTGLTNVADLAATGTGAAAATITTVQGATSIGDIAGVTIYDVDATSGDMEIAVFTEASFWAHAMTWAVDPAVDTVEAPDGTLVACTPYNTGTFGSDYKTTRRLQSQYVENSEFSHMGFMKEGERNNG